MQSLDLLC